MYFHNYDVHTNSIFALELFLNFKECEICVNFLNYFFSLYHFRYWYIVLSTKLVVI